jgi:putative oxidoreductase
MIGDLGLLAARALVGGGIFAHGAQKRLGWYGGPGREGAAGFMHSVGFRPGDVFADTASTTEMASGALIALGLGGPIGPAALLSVMIVAGKAVHGDKGFFAQQGGWELAGVYGAAGLSFAESGYGKFSLDALFGWDEGLHGGWPVGLAVIGGALGALGVLALRVPPSPPAADGTAAAPPAAPEPATNAATGDAKVSEAAAEIDAGSSEEPAA